MSKKRALVLPTCDVNDLSELDKKVFYTKVRGKEKDDIDMSKDGDQDGKYSITSPVNRLWMYHNENIVKLDELPLIEKCEMRLFDIAFDDTLRSVIKFIIEDGKSTDSVKSKRHLEFATSIDSRKRDALLNINIEKRTNNLFVKDIIEPLLKIQVINGVNGFYFNFDHETFDPDINRHQLHDQVYLESFKYLVLLLLPNSYMTSFHDYFINDYHDIYTIYNLFVTNYKK
jgi:hypothetical protein